MVRLKQLVGLPQPPHLYPSDSSSSSSSGSSEILELCWCKMTRRMKEIVVTRAMTLDIGPDGTLSLEDGS